MPVRFGILGAARIAPHALIDPARVTPGVEVVAIAARDPARARLFAAANGIPMVMPDYISLVESCEVDAIYNALPPALHAQLTIAALKAGKHVLCEKPFAMSRDEAEEMAAAARASGCVLMEAVHCRYHPLFIDVLAIIQSGRIGELQRIEAFFTAEIADAPGQIRHQRELGGGALMDLGVYCVHWCRTLAGREPLVVRAQSDLAGSGVDLGTRAELDFGDGLTAEIYCAMDQPHRTALTAIGTAGRITVQNPLSPHRPHQVTLEVDGSAQVRTYTDRPTYAFQLDAFLSAIGGDAASILVDAMDSVRNTLVIDQIREISEIQAS